MATILPSLWQRALHQLHTEVRRERGLLLLWLLLLVVTAFANRDMRTTDVREYMPSFVPVLVGVVLIIRLVWADHPGSSDTASLTRPIGRGALWLGKITLLLLAGVLPWCLAHHFKWQGYGLQPMHWAGVILILALPALTLAGTTGWLAGWKGGRAAVLVLGGIGAVALLLPVIARSAPIFSELVLRGQLDSLDKARESWFGPSDLNLCRSVVVVVLLASLSWIAWWRQCMGDSRRRQIVLVGAGLLATMIIFANWSWNWRSLPQQRYAGPKPGLHLGSQPEGHIHALWPSVYLTGLPSGKVAAIVAFAPVRAGEREWPPRKSFSDYYDDKQAPKSRWMTPGFDRELAAQFPATAMCIGERNETRRPLKKIVADEARRTTIPEGTPWRLRLAVYSLQRVEEKPLGEMLKQRTQISPALGLKLDFIDSELWPASLRLDATLRQRMPAIVPRGPFARMQPRGVKPASNLLFSVYSPGLDELILTKDLQSWQQSNSTFWEHAEHVPVLVDVPLPVIHQQVAGLKLDDWLHDSRFAIWWPVEQGIVDLELTAEDLRQALSLQP